MVLLRRWLADAVAVDDDDLVLDRRMKRHSKVCSVAVFPLLVCYEFD